MSTPEISQATYVELIYTTVREGKAFAPDTATVENSLARLAYGRSGPYRDVAPQTPPKVVPRALNAYNISSTEAAPTSQALRIQRVADEFNKLLRNSDQPYSESVRQEMAVQAVPSCTRIVNGEFTTGITGWGPDGSSQIAWDSVNGRITINYGAFSQTMTGLTPGNVLQVTMKIFWTAVTAPSQNPDGSIPPPPPADAAWAVRVRVWKDLIGTPGGQMLDESITGAIGTNQTVTFTGAVSVGSSGIVVIHIANSEYSNAGSVYITQVQFDDISVCELGAPQDDPCLEPITEVKTLVQWSGVPRTVVNVFNQFLRCTFRDQDSPQIKTVVDVYPTQDGRLGVIAPTSCGASETADFWKQQGNGGSVQGLITSQGLNPAVSASVVNGLVANVASKTNWLWSIPGSRTATLKDALISAWSNGQAGILESVEVFMLTQVVNRAPSVGISEQVYFAGATAVVDDGSVVGGAATPMTQHAIAAPPASLAAGGSPAIVAYESFSGYDLANSFWRSVGTPRAYTNIALASIRSLGEIEFHYTLPSIPPPYDHVDLAAYFMRIFRSSNSNNSFSIGITLILNGFAVTAASFTPPVAATAGTLQDFSLTQGGFSIGSPYTSPLTSIKVRINFSYMPLDPAATVPVLEILPPILKFRTAGASTTPTCVGPFAVTDPAAALDMVLRYRNGRGQLKEFRVSKNQSALYQTSELYPNAPNVWDAQVALGNGVKSALARWESASFVLDAVNGSGLDQCTTPPTFLATGRGTLNLKGLLLDGRADFRPECEAEVQVSELAKGVSINEQQSIVLPGPTGGTWSITFNYARQTGTTATLPWNATAGQVRDALADIPIIGAGNVDVSGLGTAASPFLVTFKGLLAARDIRPVAANGDGLTGASAASVVKLNVGTFNERQTITKNSTNANLRVSFNGVQSILIQSNASLNAMQSALEGISTLGAGSISVTGNTTDRDAAYQGPWYVDFLSGQNVPTMLVTGGYSVTTNWQGAVGINDTQKVSVAASGGSFKIIITNPESVTGDPETATTADIAFDASADAVKGAMVAACSWLSEEDLIVAKLGTRPHEWTVTFAGQWASQEFPLLDVDGELLQGASITVGEVTKGGGAPEKQKIRLIKAKGGSYRLKFTINGGAQGTTLIPWNADAEGVELALKTLPVFSQDDDISVSEVQDRDPDVTAAFVIVFGRRFGDVPMITVTNRLLCDPLTLPAVDAPPYEYGLPDCDDAESPYCSSGPLLCRPGEGDEEEEVEACSIRESANVYREVILQRDLFDPNSLTSGRLFTIRDLAALKGLRPSLYSAYSRDFTTGKLRPIAMSTEVTNRLSVVLVETAIDTKTTRDRIVRDLVSKPNILPSRVV